MSRASEILAKIKPQDEAGKTFTWEQLNSVLAKSLKDPAIIEIMKLLKTALKKPIQNSTEFSWNMLNDILFKKGWSTKTLADLLANLNRA